MSFPPARAGAEDSVRPAPIDGVGAFASLMAQRVDPALSARAQAALQDCAQGRLPPNLAAMHLLMDQAGLSALERAIASTQAPESAERLKQARAFALGS